MKFLASAQGRKRLSTGTAPGVPHYGREYTLAISPVVRRLFKRPRVWPDRVWETRGAIATTGALPTRGQEDY